MVEKLPPSSDICDMSQATAKMNKWIFGAVIGIVISIPFLIPGCTPFSPGGADSNINLMGTVDHTEAEPAVDMANATAEAAGRATTLQDVISAADSGNSTSITSLLGGTSTTQNQNTTPVYTLAGKGSKQYLSVTIGRNKKQVCTVKIDTSGHAILNCP